MELKPIPISKIRHFLIICGLELGASKGDFEHWTDSKGKDVIICVSENSMPPTSIGAMLVSLNDNAQKFMQIISVIC